MTAICGNCRFWEFKHKPSDDDAVGECLRRAPIPLQAIASMIGRALGAAAWAAEASADIEHDEKRTDYTFDCVDQYEVHEWPLTQASQWCGDHELGDHARDTWERSCFVDVWQKTELPKIIETTERHFDAFSRGDHLKAEQ